MPTLVVGMLAVSLGSLGKHGTRRNHFEIIGNGEGVRWPAIDEDISANGMLSGAPARPPKKVTTGV